MSTNSPATVIIAIPGGQETQELTLAEAHAAIARGEIEPHQWAWSSHLNNWIPVSDLPELQLPAVQPTPVPTFKISSAPVAIAASQAVNRSQTSASLVVKEEAGFSFLKLFVIVLMLVIFGVVGANYILIDQPLQTNLTQTPFSTVPVHAHLGAFMQPNALVIHLLPEKSVTADNLANFLVTLARSTPQIPFGHQSFKTIGLTNAWTSQYVILGNDWQTLGQMDKASPDEKKTFILGHLLYASGTPLLIERSTNDPDVLAKYRDKAWANLVASLIHQ